MDFGKNKRRGWSCTRGGKAAPTPGGVSMLREPFETIVIDRYSQRPTITPRVFARALIVAVIAVGIMLAVLL